MQQVDSSSRNPGKWTKCMEFLLDFAAVVLVSTDIVTDVLVIHEFWMAKKMTVFYVGVVILCCAQASYLMLFFMYFLVDGDILRTSESCRWVKVFFIMLCVAPFGQLVPLFIWIESHRLPWLDNVLNRLGWSNGGSDPQMQEGQDPLIFWILSKVQKHGGFIIESLIEALPQSILQIVALMFYKHVTPLSIYSIISSMTSVAIRGVMVSYSLNRATFVFNIVCFAADIFNIFSCFSWAFWDSGIIFPWTDNFWRFNKLQDVYGQIWFNQMLCITAILGFIIALFLITFLIVLFFDLLKHRNCRICDENNRSGSFIGWVLETIFFVFIIIPLGFSMIVTAGFTGLLVLMMVCQIFKLWPWCFVFTLFESEHIARFEMFYRPWINWLFSSPTSFDWDCRFGVSFRFLARMKSLRFRAMGNEELSQKVLKVPFDKLTCRVLRRDVLEMGSNRWEVCCRMPKKAALSPAQNVNFNDVRRARGVRDDQWIWEQYFVYGYWRMCSGLVLYVLLPLQIVSLLYNLVYPFLAFSKAGLDAQYIQIVLSSIYFLLLGVALLCFPVMYRYRRLIYAVPVQAIDLRNAYMRVGSDWSWERPDMLSVFNSIEKEYAMELNQIYIDQILQHFFQHLAPLMMEMLGPQRNPTFDQEIYFRRDPLLYRNQDRLTIFELKDVSSIMVKAYDNEMKLSTVDCGLMTPLLDNHEDDCANLRS